MGRSTYYTHYLGYFICHLVGICLSHTSY
jgi:hypothetical protein